MPIIAHPDHHAIVMPIEFLSIKGLIVMADITFKVDQMVHDQNLCRFFDSELKIFRQAV